MNRSLRTTLCLTIVAGLTASAAPVAGADPVDLANVLLTWTNDSTPVRLHVVLDAGATQSLLWTADFAHPIDAASAGAVGALGPVVVVGRHAASDTVVELRSLATGTIVCEAAVPWPHLGGYVHHHFGFEDVDGVPGNEMLVLGGDHRGGLRTHQFYALDAGCATVRSVAGAITSTGSDPARLDGLAWADATGDGRVDGIVMLGASLYSGSQPKIEVADLVAGTATQRVSDTFTGSGMTSLVVGDVAGGAGLDFITGGWWGPMVAVYSETGARLWSGDASGSCGSADHVPLLDPVTKALFIGSGEYSGCSPMKVYRVNPATGAVLWSQAGDEAAGNFPPLAAGDLDGDGDREMVAFHTRVTGCVGDRATYVLDADTGAKLTKICNPSPVFGNENVRFLPSVVDDRTALYVVSPGPYGACATGQLCAMRLDGTLGALWTVPLATPAAFAYLESYAVDVGASEHAQILAAIQGVPSSTASLIIPVVREEGAATRSAVADEGQRIRGHVSAEANRTQGVLRDEHAATRGLLESVREALLNATKDLQATLLAAIQDTRTAILGAIEDATSRILDAIAATEARILGRVGQEHEATRQHVTNDSAETRDHVSNVIRNQSSYDALELLLIRSPAAEAIGQGPFRVVVTLRGIPVEASVTASLDGEELPDEAVQPGARPGERRVLTPPATKASLLVVTAFAGTHAGTAAAWMGPAERLEAPMAPPEWGQALLLDETVTIEGRDAGAEPVSVPLTRIQGEPQADGSYTLGIILAGNDFGILRIPQGGAAPPRTITFDEAPGAGPVHVDGRGVQATVSYHYDSAAPRCLVEQEGTCLLVAPFDPTSAWATDRGMGATIVVKLRLLAEDGSVIEERIETIPLFGQLLGTAVPSA